MEYIKFQPRPDPEPDPEPKPEPEVDCTPPRWMEDVEQPPPEPPFPTETPSSD